MPSAGNSNETNERLKKIIAESWERCRAYGIDMDMRAAEKCVSKTQMNLILSENRTFLEKATPIMDNLYNFVKDSGFMVTLSDRSGVLLRVVGDEKILQTAQSIHFDPGYYWSEDTVGTNAISIAMDYRAPVQVFADEHYCKFTQQWTCSAAPVFHKDQIIGVLNMSAHYSNVQGHTLGMAAAAANAIEALLKEADIQTELVLANSLLDLMMQNMDEGIVAIDTNSRIMKLNDKMCAILDVSEKSTRKTALGNLCSVGVIDDLKRMKPSEPMRDTILHLHNGTQKAMMAKCRPIFDDGRSVGFILYFSEMQSVKKLVNTMAGSTAHFVFKDIIGNEERLLGVISIAKRIATSSSTVLITGESGTGKEMFAQAIHNESNRRNGPFIAINCGAIPRDLIESELFGYVEGAFTGAKKHGNPGKFELAEGGTIFLDEIGDMPFDMQVALLRVIERKSVTRIGSNRETPTDVRVIAATNKDLRKAVNEDKFREDLYYRLNVLNITIPPLRERKNDIPLLTEYYIDKYSAQLRKKITGISSEALSVLSQYDWPGNVRELQNTIERAVNISPDPIVCADALGIERTKNIRNQSVSQALISVEEDTIKSVLSETGFNVTKAAEQLGIGKATIYRKMKRFGIHRTK